MDFKATELWKNSLGNDTSDFSDQRNELISEYLRVRDNAKFLLDKIRKDFPSLTVHDISHVDGLWQVASVITGKRYNVNPLEGFILGCAFLFHDAVLSYDAVGGVDHLRELDEWKDYYEDFKNDKTKSHSEILHETDFITIRKLHAKKAEQLHHQLFEKDDGSSFYLIENKGLRDHYGEVICKIAGSHHWSFDEVGKMDTQLPASSEYPQEWRINSLKLACILRCADAGHIDDGRAPDYLLELLNINGVSKDHWIAQNRLSQIDIDRYNQDNVIIKSNISFKEDDFASWNVAYDAVQVLDHELKKTNELFRRKGIDEFSAKGVSGAASREELCKYIKTEGWEPFDACIHISNVESLIMNLGGEKLYGKDHKLEIVLRELIQNARDAICARKKVDAEYCNGRIQIEITTSTEGTWVSVKDNGVGMSIDTVKNYFLNFGSSFWSSDLAKKEFVGLNSSGFKSIGTFGIGFYSVFMVSSTVIVETRKYDSSLDDNLILKFPSGFCLRPIIAHKRGTTNTSTCVKFLIDSNTVKWCEKMTIKPAILGGTQFEVPYASVIGRIIAGLDVDVFYRELGGNERLIHKNINDIHEGSAEVADWLKDITYARYRDDPSFSNYIDKNYKRLRKIVINGKLLGFAGINTFWNSQSTFFDVSTVDGLSTVSNDGDNGDYLGCLIHKPITASRDRNEEDVDRKEWAKEQYSILYQNGLSDVDKLYLPYVVGKYGIDMTDIMRIAYYNHNAIYTCQLTQLICTLAVNKEKLVIGLSSFTKNKRADNYLDYAKSASMLNNDEILFVPVRNTNFLNLEDDDNAYPINLFWCIREAGKKMGLHSNMIIEEHKVYAAIEGSCRGLVISFRRENS